MKPDNKGFFLLEALVGLVIMTACISVMIYSLAQGFRATVFSRDFTAASLLAENAMSGLLIRKTIDFPLRDSGVFDGQEKFSYEMESGQALSPEKESIRDVRLTVTWPSGSREQSIVVASFFPGTPDKEAP